MFLLNNDSLEITILDPVADQKRLGTRYCAGGYIFQVTDVQLGDLLTGPTYPDSFNMFDGQGIPDAFNRSPLHEPQSTGPDALVIGVGLCDLQADTVTEFCPWDVTHEPSKIYMRTEQTFEGFALELERTVTLYRRTVRSEIRFKNTGSQHIPIRWFPHPFFPHAETDELCRFNAPVRFPENPVYVLGEDGFIHRRRWPWSEGHFQALDHDARANLVVLQRHPALGLVAATCSYIPGFFPIWGNGNTFSWEPYFERTVAPGQEANWWIDYDF